MTLDTLTKYVDPIIKSFLVMEFVPHAIEFKTPQVPLNN